MIRLLCFAAILTCLPTQKVYSQLASKNRIPALSWGMMQRIPEFKSEYIGKRTVDIFFPEEYPAYPANRYPVIYMHDGQMLFDSSETWNHQEWGIDESMRDYFKRTGRTCIVVAIHNAGSGRYAEYFPKKPFDNLSKEGKEKIAELSKKDSGRLMENGSPVSDQYLLFLVKELKPMVDNTFRTKSDPASTFLCGSSMGGLISLYGICEYPSVFGAAACLSTHWPGIFDDRNNPVPASFLQYLKKHAPSPTSHRIYMDCGNTGLDSLYPKYHLQAERILKSKGYSKKKIQSRIIKGAGHDEKAWKARMPEVLEFLLNK